MLVKYVQKKSLTSGEFDTDQYKDINTAKMMAL